MSNPLFNKDEEETTKNRKLCNEHRKLRGAIGTKVILSKKENSISSLEEEAELHIKQKKKNLPMLDSSDSEEISNKKLKILKKNNKKQRDSDTDSKSDNEIKIKKEKISSSSSSNPSNSGKIKQAKGCSSIRSNSSDSDFLNKTRKKKINQKDVEKGLDEKLKSKEKQVNSKSLLFCFFS